MSTPAVKRGGARPNRKAKTTAETRKALVFGMLAQGKGHDEIAKVIGISKRRVQEIGAEFAGELEKRAAEVKTAAIDGATEAKRLAREAGPAVMQRLIAIALYKPPAIAELAELDVDTRLHMLTSGPDVADQTRAGIAVLDRGGVPAKVEADLGGAVLEDIKDLLTKARRIP